MRGERQIVTTSRVVWSLPSPANWADVEAVFGQIRSALSSLRLFDDTVRVEAWDDEIRISYETSDGAS